MALYINTNMAAITAQNNLSKSQSSLSTSLQRLSSGLRINSAADDAAGMAIASRMSSQINGLDQAARNANDGISLTQTASGAMNTIADNLQTMRSLAVQSSNASATASDRVSINNEIQQLSAEIQRVATTTNFNGTTLLDGSFNAQNFQVGANTGNTITVASVGDMQTSQLGSAGTTFAAATTGGATTAALAAGDLTLNGVQVGASQLGAGPGQSTASAYAIAAAINAVAGSSGVNATANATTVAGVAATASAAVPVNANSGFTINGVAVGAIAGGGSAAGQGANVAAAINLVASQTGVKATADASTGAVSLSAADGRDIAIATNGTYATLTADTGLTGGVTTHGTVTLSSTSATGIVQGGALAASAGFLNAGQAIVAVATANVSSIAAMNTLTASSSASAITTIDGALATVNTAMGQLGALQNRFTSAVSNMQTAVQNLTASRSRIQDTDFAATTGMLTRSQILQQAGTAMLAQANSAPNGVMALLR